jgi:prophage regulatory protein
MQKLYRAKELSEALSISKSTIYLWIKQGNFPEPLKIGKNASVWSEGQINDWMEKVENNSLNKQGD